MSHEGDVLPSVPNTVSALIDELRLQAADIAKALDIPTDYVIRETIEWQSANLLEQYQRTLAAIAEGHPHPRRAAREALIWFRLYRRRVEAITSEE